MKLKYVKILMIFFIVMSIVFDTYGSLFYDDDPYNDYGYDGYNSRGYDRYGKDKYGDYDYSDGDLEDKIDDEEIYGSLFSDEVRDDYKSSTKTDINNPIVIYIKDVSKTTNYGWKLINGFYFYKKSDGSFQKGWKQIDNKWYYFDKESGAAYKNQFVEDGKKIYYIKSDFTMAINELMNINGMVVYANENGECEVVNG